MALESRMANSRIWVFGHSIIFPELCSMCHIPFRYQLMHALTEINGDRWFSSRSDIGHCLETLLTVTMGERGKYSWQLVCKLLTMHRTAPPEENDLTRVSGCQGRDTCAEPLKPSSPMSQWLVDNVMSAGQHLKKTCGPGLTLAGESGLCRWQT